MVNEVIRALVSVDWDFVDAPANSGIHAIHPYPAKFIPQIPHKLIELFHPHDSSIILDPFCGSGTTLVEAVNMGFDAVGVDVNPLACLIAKVKTTPLPEGLSTVIKRVIRRAKEQLSADLVQVPHIPRLDHWFKADIQKALAALVDQTNAEYQTIFRDALRVALSSIVVRVSNQESDTRYAAIEKNVSYEDVFSHFEGAATSLGEALYSFTDDLFRHLGQATVTNRDVLSLNACDLPANIGLVVTSPPYPNAYEYWLYHKYRMYWLGMDPIDVRQHEIGARPHYFKVNSQDEHDFERQMSMTFRLLSEIMNLNAKACFLIGRSVLHGRVIDNVSLLQRAARTHGFVTEGIVERRIPATRKTFNPEYGKINREHIIVFRLKTKL